MLKRANRVDIIFLIHLLIDLVGLPNDHDRLGERHVVNGELEWFLAYPSIILLDGFQLVASPSSFLMWQVLLE